MPSFTSIANRHRGGGGVCSPCFFCCPWSRGGGYYNGDDDDDSESNHQHRSLGPFADSLGINVRVAFWLCVAQLPIMVGLALHYPTVRVDLYTTVVRTAYDSATNRTVVAATDGSAVGVHSYDHGVGISGLYVLNAASFAIFAVMSMNFLDRGIAAAEGRGMQAMASEEFVAQNLPMLSDPTFRSWNQAFTISTLLVHAVVTATVCSPVSWDVIFTAVLLLYLSLGQMVQPMDNFLSEHGAQLTGGGDAALMASSASSTASQGMLIRAGLCMLTVGYILMRIPLDQQSCKSQFVLLLACLDGFMLFGHLWDRVPSLQVVLNCRLLYTCSLALFNAALFLTWRDCTSVAFMSSSAAKAAAAAAASGSIIDPVMTGITGNNP